MDAQTLKTFDEDTVDSLKETAQQKMAQHPEVRSVIVVVDYQNKMNSSNVRSAFWMGDRDGQAPKTIDALIGGIGQVTIMLEKMYFHIVGASEGLAKDVEQKTEALLEAEETYRAIKQKVAEAEAEYTETLNRRGGSVRSPEELKRAEAEAEEEEES